MKNYSIYEDGDGGELLIENNKIRYTDALYTMVYLRLFGGNIDGNTTREDAIGEFYKGWWGNDRNGDSDEWINSDTERLLIGMPLTSANQLRVEEAVKKDLKDIEQYGSISVEVTYPNLNRVQIWVLIEENKRKEEVVILWDATKQEVIYNRTI